MLLLLIQVMVEHLKVISMKELTLQVLIKLQQFLSFKITVLLFLLPVEKQTAAKTLAQKAVAAGIPGIQVDGMDRACCLCCNERCS